MPVTEVLVELSRIVINEQSHEQIIVLKQKDSSRHFPIVIGIFEAWAIERRVKDVPVPRPMTHDLLARTIELLGGELRRVTVTDFEKGTFFAELCIHQAKGDIKIDSRPSDAIALAVRMNVPIFVNESVFQKLSECN